MSSALRNLAALKRSITRRVRQALEELQENLGHGLDRAPQRVPVPIPAHQRNPRNFQRCAPLDICALMSNTFRYKKAFSCPLAGSTRFFSTFFSYKRFSHNPFHDLRWQKARASLSPLNFAGRNSFHQKAVNLLYRIPTLTQLSKKKFHLAFEEENERTITLQMRLNLLKFAGISNTAFSLQFNLLTTPKFHDAIMKLAKPANDHVPGCYVDFKIFPRIMIPSATVMNADVLGELLSDLKKFEKLVVELRNDLEKLSELGELPLRYIASQNTIRVYFPNCDREKLEALLVEKNVSGGIVHEDVSNECELSDSEGILSSISEFDIMSDSDMNSLPSLSSGSTGYDEILSSTSSSAPDRIVRLEDEVDVADSIEIVSQDDFHWA